MIMTNSQKKTRLYALKNELNMDVYYQIDCNSFVEPVIRNRVNNPNPLTGKNSWTGFTVYVICADQDDKFWIYLVWQDETFTPVIKKNPVEADEVMYWMKQLYSVGRIILKEMDHDPVDTADIKSTAVYSERLAKLKVREQLKSN